MHWGRCQVSIKSKFLFRIQFRYSEKRRTISRILNYLMHIKGHITALDPIHKRDQQKIINDWSEHNHIPAYGHYIFCKSRLQMTPYRFLNCNWFLYNIGLWHWHFDGNRYGSLNWNWNLGIDKVQHVPH